MKVARVPSFCCHSVLWLTRVLLLKYIQFKQTKFCMTKSCFFITLGTKSQVIQQYSKCTVLKLKPSTRHVWSSSSFLNCHDTIWNNTLDVVCSISDSVSKKRHPVTGRFIFTMAKTKYCMSFVDMFTAEWNTASFYCKHRYIKTRFRKGPIPRGPLEKQLHRPNWFRKKENKLNF